MNIRFLYYEDCPSHETALERLQMVMNQENISSEVEVIKVETEDQANSWKFVGSPTILINGEDIVPPPEDAQYNLTCRAYRLENGRISPLPSEIMIRDALQAHQVQEIS